MGINGDFLYKNGENIAGVLSGFVDNHGDNLYLCLIKTYPHDSQVAKFIH